MNATLLPKSFHQIGPLSYLSMYQIGSYISEKYHQLSP